MSQTTRLAVILLLILPTLGGCAKPKPTPEKTYEEFHAAITKYAREPHAVYRMRAFNLLTRRSKAVLETRADAFNAKLPEGLPELEPNQMLRVRAMQTNLKLGDVTVVATRDDEVDIEVELGDTKRIVTMVREGEAWKVEMFEP